MVYRKSPAPRQADDQTRSLPDRSAASTLHEHPDATKSEQLQQFIQEVTADLKDLEKFYNISISPTRVQRLGEYLVERTNELVVRFWTFDGLDQEGKVDWLLIRAYIKRRQQRLREDWAQIQRLSPLLDDWATGLIELCERRQRVLHTHGKDAAQILSDAGRAIESVGEDIRNDKLKGKVGKFTAYRAVQAIRELESRMQEWYGFYNDYDPLFTWWVSSPMKHLPGQLQGLSNVIREHLVGIRHGVDYEDDIVGQPSGRDSILSDLQLEMIPYTPEELIDIGEKEYEWCEREMIEASKSLGYGDEWRRALEHVKNLYVEPGQQTYEVHELAAEAVKYVKDHDMVTIPEIAEETWRTFMMSPARQKVNPFFLGGDSIQVSYPTASMSHEDKLMIMRGNSRPFSRSTVFHELLPGHHLQFHFMNRYRPYRKTFMTPFWVEGWAFYWEFILWDRGFPATHEDKIGMLFWRMHRCARIVFSLKFHLGQMTPQECIDYLVEKVGHERATAEGEVRRSFNGDYTPLYQAGYMVGALQLYALRREMVDAGKILSEKEFHDHVLKENSMPIEMVRALLKGEKLTPQHKPSWRFYDRLQEQSGPITT